MPDAQRFLPAPEARRTAESTAPGRAWLAALPGIIGQLEQAWSVTVGDALHGGKHAYVARARIADGSPVVIKVAPPGTGFATQVAVLAAARGRGYVRVLASDLERHAALLEPLGAILAGTAMPSEQALGVLAAALRMAWQVPLAEVATVTARTSSGIAAADNKASQLIATIEELWPELGQPCPARVVSQALDYARRRRSADDPRSRVLCHGDPHPGNALAVPVARPGTSSGFVLIDPEGLPVEPAYDLGVLVRGWTRQVLSAADPVSLVRGYCGVPARATGVDAQAIWEWGFTERVSSGLYLMRCGHLDEGRAYLDSADWLSTRSEDRRVL